VPGQLARNAQKALHRIGEGPVMPARGGVASPAIRAWLSHLADLSLAEDDHDWQALLRWKTPGADDQPNADGVHEHYSRVPDALRVKLPAGAEHLDAARPRRAGVQRLFEEHLIWRQMEQQCPRTTNRKIRTDVVGIFPERNSRTRLVGGRARRTAHRRPTALRRNFPHHSREREGRRRPWQPLRSAPSVPHRITWCPLHTPRPKTLTGP